MPDFPPEYDVDGDGFVTWGDVMSSQGGLKSSITDYLIANPPFEDPGPGGYDVNNDGRVNVQDSVIAGNQGNPQLQNAILDYVLNITPQGDSNNIQGDSNNMGDNNQGSNPFQDPGVGGYDLNQDNSVNIQDAVIAFNQGNQELGTAIYNYVLNISPQAGPSSTVNTDLTQVSGMQNLQTSQIDLGISTGAVGSREELKKMLTSYQGRSSLIQSAQRQKAIFTIDRFDGGLNQNKAPRDLAYWEACQMDELAPSKVGRLIRLGDFKTAANTLTSADATWQTGNENYGLHYLKMSTSIDSSGDPEDGVPTEYAAILDDDGSGTDQKIHLVELSSKEKKTVVTALGTSCNPVFHNADNRLYVSDANFASGTAKTYVGGIVDRPKLYPYTDSIAVDYHVSGTTASKSFASQSLYYASPTAGVGNNQICVSGHSAGFSRDSDSTAGIYILTEFVDITANESSGIGWGGSSASSPNNIKCYKFYASFLYDNGSESKLSDVTTSNNTTFDSAQKVTATTDSDGNYQKLIVRQVLIDGAYIYANNPRIHGARFYYTEVTNDDSANPIGNDKYLWAELDFRYGLKLMSEFGNWNLFSATVANGGNTSDTNSTGRIQVENAANTGTGFDSDATSSNEFGTLSMLSPPTAFTYYSLNLFHQEELKDDLMWATSTMGNGIAFIGNIEYDGRQYPDTMLYSGAGETDAGSAYPMWGTFPVDSNRIDIPGAAGEITALKWTSNRVLQFRKNALYVINVEDVLAPRVEGVYQGMGVAGQYAVTETPFGVAWVNGTGCYAYNSDAKNARSLTIGRLDTEDFQTGSPHASTKIGYDDRAKMLIIGNYSKNDTDGYFYAYSFVTDAWCTWNVNKADIPQSNFAINHDGYLTGYLSDKLYKWSATPSTAVIVDYITKDIDLGKPNLDKRFYTLYISFTGGSGQEDLYVYFRANGMEGTDLVSGWTQLESIEDYTNPYGSNTGSAWATSGTPTTGDPVVPTAVNDLDSRDIGDVQKLAKINLRHLSGSLPADYLKFARSIQFRIKGTAAATFEINDISLVFKEKRIK